MRLSALNVLYYNPMTVYLPWKNGDGTSMPSADFTQARSNPISTQPGYSLQRDLTGFVYEEWIDSHGFSGPRPRRGNNINRTTGANGQVDFWDEHTRYTINANDITVENTKYTVDSSGRLNNDVTTSTVTSLLDANGAIITLMQIKQNIANWYQYHRRRSFVAKAAIAEVIDNNPNYRYGLNVINDPIMFTPVPDTVKPPFDTHNTNLIKNFFKYPWQPVGTPLRGGLNRVGEYFENTDGKIAPIVEACQQNYSILLTDGFWNNPEYEIGTTIEVPLPSKIDDNDGDNVHKTLADVSYYYYHTDLSPALPNSVMGNTFDPLASQHLVTYAIAFGLNGLLTDTDNDGWPSNFPGLTENSDWGDPLASNNDVTKIDDLWHAAYNGRGGFISASSPEAISKSLADALAHISANYSSSASVGFNSANLTSGTRLYQVKFKDFAGDVVAYDYDTTKQLFKTTPIWSASQALNGQTQRAIVTYDGYQGVAFNWDSLSLSQKIDLFIEPNLFSSTLGKAKAKVDYLRGDRANEVGNNGIYKFRKRLSLLGDIIDSSPITVGKPKSSWPNSAPFPTSSGQSYSDFALSKANRSEIIYAGANDGMLHGFKTSNGSEALAYIPGLIFSSTSGGAGLHELTDPEYSHRYYVDMPSVVEDAYFDTTGTGISAAWHSILVGGARGGGKGVFALDITDPANFSEANANKTVLWEFDSSDDADMGYSFSVPTIAMLNNNRWAAILGNGYNNTGDGKAKLLILFLDGGLDGTWTAGTDYIELSTDAGNIVSNDCANASSGCNGLSTPQTVDTNNDYIVDRVYAGDLQGNMWAFDLTNTDAEKWAIAYSGKPLFTAEGPITNKPAVITHPDEQSGAPPNLLVFFGTGQYLTIDDINSTAAQGFYGVWDHGSASLKVTDLQEQTFLTTVLFSKDANGNNITASPDFRVLSNNTVDYKTQQGWFIKLQHGERVTTAPLIYEDAVLFNTRIPSSESCTSGGNGSQMFVPQTTGGRATFDIFDVNKDNSVSSSDSLFDNKSVTYAVSGIMVHGKFPEQSSVISNLLITPDSDTTIDTTLLYTPSKGSMKRLSWQEYQNQDN